MKKFFKGLALVLALVLVLGTIPASNASAKVKTSKKLYLNGGSAKKNTAKLYKLAGVSKADASKVTAESSDSKIVKAGSKKLTAKAAGVADVKVFVDGELVTTVKVTVKDLAAKEAKLEAKATGAKQITVSGVAEDATITVKRGNTALTFTKEFVDGKAVLTLDTKIRAAEYTVSDGTSTVSFTGEDERAEQIVIAENGGLINCSADGRKAYAHYDVYNQYGEHGETLRKSFSPSWTSSVGTAQGDASTGIITITRNDAATNKFNYNDFVSIVAVYTKGTNSISAQANVQIGLPVAVGTINIEGILLKDTTTILKEVPQDFQTKTYYILYSMNDANGYALKWNATDAAKLSVTSFNPLVATIANPVSSIPVNGKTYGYFTITPAMNAVQGGKVNFLVISTANGLKSDLEVYVQSEQILQSFTILAPDADVIENEQQEIGFEAVDTNGNAVTNFRVFDSSLTLGNFLTLKEKDDGTAKLLLNVNDNTRATYLADGIAFLTSTVTKTGNVSNVQVTVKDERYATAVAEYVGKDTMVKLDTVTVKVNNDHSNSYLKAFDQYDRVYAFDDMKQVNPAALGYSRWKVVAITPDETNEVYSTYEFTGAGPTLGGLDDADSTMKYFDMSAGAVTFTANKFVGDSKTYTVEFALAGEKRSEAGHYEIIPGSSIKQQFTVVDISKVTNLSLGGSATIQNGVALAGSHTSTTSTTLKVSGKYGTKDVTVPNQYVEYQNNYDNTYITTAKEGAWSTKCLSSADVITTGVSDVAPSGDAEKFFNKDGSKNVDGTYKTVDRATDVTARVYGLNAAYTDINSDDLKATLSGKVTVSVNAAHYNSFTAGNAASGVNGYFTNDANTEAVIFATDGKIKASELRSFLAKTVDNYGKKIDVTTTTAITISDFVETDKGLDAFRESAPGSSVYVKNSAAITRNATSGVDAVAVEITYAEIGDTFTATFSYDWASYTIKFTVGSDKNAKIVGTNNHCTYR